MYKAKAMGADSECNKYLKYPKVMLSNQKEITYKEAEIIYFLNFWMKQTIGIFILSLCKNMKYV